MAQLDLKPLSIAEILDRTFTIYRGHFLLFAGIAAVPQVFVLALQLLKLFSISGVHSSNSPFPSITIFMAGVVALIVALASLVATFYSEAATILGISDLYLGRVVTLSNCLSRAWSQIGTVFVVALLNGLAIIAGAIALIIPGIYIGCRLIVAVQAALVEGRTAREALSRSWELTRENAGRAFLLILIYSVVSIALGLLFGLPAGLAISANKNNPTALQLWLAVEEVASSLLNIVLQPIVLIATSLFYFDLRVRKEAFDLQFMMDPNSERQTPPGTGSVPTIL